MMQPEIERLVAQYVISINEADTDLAAQTWATTHEISFIHPRGHERGWEQVKRNFYEQTMRDRFSKRHLQIEQLEMALYEQMAIVVFYSQFNATFRENGESHHTQGRKTQAFLLTDQQWRLVHVHYSGLPVTGVREGF